MTNLLDYRRIYQAHGFQRLIDEIRENFLYDLIHGVDTQSYKPLSRYSTKHISGNDIVQYQPVYTSVVRESLRIACTLTVRKCSFLDAGSGKGKVLLEARKLGFEHIYGVELDPELHSISKSNLAKHDCERCTLINANVLDVPLPDDIGVIFLYHPFHERIMKTFIDTIERHCSERKIACLIIYVRPKYDALLSNWRKLHEFSKYMQDTAVFGYYPDDQAEVTAC
ncbi:MAG: class I SAM-dependent methyltransferase [Pseudomonadales bacterium]|nr:class I SAM-dependent methyltransferase [Pseudomonadales bacterium]